MNIPGLTPDGARALLDAASVPSDTNAATPYLPEACAAIRAALEVGEATCNPALQVPADALEAGEGEEVCHELDVESTRYLRALDELQRERERAATLDRMLRTAAREHESYRARAEQAERELDEARGWLATAADRLNTCMRQAGLAEVIGSIESTGALRDGIAYLWERASEWRRDRDAARRAAEDLAVDIVRESECDGALWSIIQEHFPDEEDQDRIQARAEGSDD